MLRRKLPVLAAIAGLIALLSPSALAQDPIVRIEEDWELKVKQPDYAITAPQIITAFSPTGNLDGIYATFEVNHLSSAYYAPGGLHLSTWLGETHLQVMHEGNFASMNLIGETVSWTQAIEVQDGRLAFEVTDGTSITWGAFGFPGWLRLERDTTLTDLSGYDVNVSVNKTKISYSENRVQYLYIKRVRYIHASGQIDWDYTDRYVHQD